ncbi:unnamed protein product [Clonostachys rosea]|uniref:Uncharacterized protein n=1 Tax=Bionectria ochroleuca TaxID=29856 RepID=A0ABY6UFU0_BIOOC|nr:unnamed protein product [Clonostachys rosea]
MGHGPPPFGPPPHGHGHHPHGPPPPPPPHHAAHHQHARGQAVPILAIIFGSIVLIVLIIHFFKFARFYLEHHATHSQDDKDKAKAKPCNGNCQCEGLPPNPKQRPGVDPPPYSNNNELEERRRLMDEDGSNYVP